MVRSTTSTPSSSRANCHEHRAGDALDDVLRYRRRDQLTAAEDEEILRAALAHVSVLGHQDCLVEAVEECLGLGECAVDVDAGCLRARRRDVVVDPPPARHLAANAPRGVDVRSERHRDDHEAVAQVVEANTDLLVRLEDERADVDIGTKVVAAHQLDGDVAQLVDAVRQLHVEHPRVAGHAREVIRHPEDVDPMLRARSSTPGFPRSSRSRSGARG